MSVLVTNPTGQWVPYAYVLATQWADDYITMEIPWKTEHNTTLSEQFQNLIEKIVEIDALNRQIYDRSLSWFGTDIQ